ncbi:MAG: hypothetical protein KAH38_04410 [Candidatus Hydrogenedentes bacterium]|nr:hypothetical protein [Candidatus Hydrogenedentota bacterium]
MKLATMKIICLLAFLGGGYMLGLVFDIGYVQQAHEQILQKWPTQENDLLNLRLPGTIAGVLLLLVGLYGLLPKFPARKNATITFKDVNGDVTLQLKPIRKVLQKVMKRMPEVYSIKLDVLPDSNGQHARIEADVILKNCAALGARQCAKIVAECLATTARDLLGLEDLSTVCLNVKGIHVDAAATGKQIRDQLALKQPEIGTPCASPCPPEDASSDSSDVQNTEENTEPDESPEEIVEAEVLHTEEEEYDPEDAVEAEEEATEPEEPAQDPEVAQESGLEQESTEEQISSESQTSEIEAEPQLEEVPDELLSDTLYGVDLPPLTDDDANLPPAPQINAEGEITTDEAAGADMSSSAYSEREPETVQENIPEPAPWVHNDLPEPVPKELNNTPSDTDSDTEEYPSV